MRKLWLAVIGVLALALVAIVAVPALAQPGDGATPPTQGWSVGRHMIGPSLDRLATTLGITTEDLAARLDAGQTLAQIATEQGVATEAVVETILAPHLAQIDIMVQYGYMTEEQAATMKQTMQERVAELLDEDLSGTGDGAEHQQLCTQMMGSGNMMSGDMGQMMQEHGKDMMGSGNMMGAGMGQMMQGRGMMGSGMMGAR